MYTTSLFVENWLMRQLTVEVYLMIHSFTATNTNYMVMLMQDKATELAYKGYRAYVEYDAEDRVFVGHVTGITDILSFHGSSVDEITENFHNCINDYLDIRQKNRGDLDRSQDSNCHRSY